VVNERFLDYARNDKDVDLAIDSSDEMKSAYELAMERLAKDQPSVSLSDAQKKQLAEIDSTCKAKIAEREVFLKDQIVKAQTGEKFEEAEQLQRQLLTDVRRLNEDCEAKKEKMRASFAK
jgi:hypothetical protein